MNPNEITETERQFLTELYKKTKGNVSAKASMFEIGAAQGLDKTEASRAAEVLIGWELVEVKTLSGAIGVTNAGIELLQQMGAAGSSEAGGAFKLGTAPVIDDAARRNIEALIGDLKNSTASLKSDFDAMSEWMADIRTADAQLTSSKPKTAVIRECLRSMKGVLEKSGDADSLKKIKSVLNE